MIYSLFRNAEHAAAKATDRTDFVSFLLSDTFFCFFLTLTGYNQTVTNVTFPTTINLRWNFQVIKTQTEGNESLLSSFLKFLSAS